MAAARPPVRLLPGLEVARKVLIEAHAHVGGMEAAILAIDVALDVAKQREAR